MSDGVRFSATRTRAAELHLLVPGGRAASTVVDRRHAARGRGRTGSDGYDGMRLNIAAPPPPPQTRSTASEHLEFAPTVPAGAATQGLGPPVAVRRLFDRHRRRHPVGNFQRRRRIGLRDRCVSRPRQRRRGQSQERRIARRRTPASVRPALLHVGRFVARFLVDGRWRRSDHRPRHLSTAGAAAGCGAVGAAGFSARAATRPAQQTDREGER